MVNGNQPENSSSEVLGKKNKKFKKLKKEKIFKQTQKETGISNKTDKKNNSKDYDDNDYNELCENEYFRFINNSEKVGHALLTKDKDGNEIAKQFNLSKSNTNKIEKHKNDAPKLKLMLDITKIKKYGKDVYLAKSPGGTEYKAKRFLDLEIKKPEKSEAKIACFSPLAKDEFWGSENKNIEIFKAEYKNKKNYSKHSKGGKYITVKGNDVSVRKGEKRNPSQNDVMGHSAVNEYRGFLRRYSKFLSPDFIQKMIKASQATVGKNIRPEWLHAMGYGLTPLNLEPQDENNLGAAPKWSNTEMMVVERMAAWFALNAPDMIVKIKPYFKMLLNSDVIEKINFETLFIKGDKEIAVKQKIYPHQKHPLYPKASDKAQGTLVMFNLIRDKKPAHVSKVIDKTGIDANNSQGNSDNNKNNSNLNYKS